MIQLYAPLYRWPEPGDAQWERLIDVKPGVIVANPESGPGTKADPIWAKLINRISGGGIRVHGYIATGYAEEVDGKQLWKVVEERERWARFYPIIGTSLGGYFYDESGSEGVKYPYYQALLRTWAGGMFAMALNHGTFPDRSYVKLPCIKCVYETSFANYMAKEPPPWIVAEPNANHWLHIVYSCKNAADMRQVVATAKRRNAGWLWCCEDDAEYNVVPSFLEEMSELIKK